MSEQATDKTERIAELRASAKRIREAAQYAERNDDRQAELRLATDLDNFANELEQEHD